MFIIRKRLLFVALVLLLFVVFGFIWFVKGIGNDFTTRNEDRVAYALKHTALKKVKTVYSFASDKHYTIISGFDRNGEKMIVWLGRGYVVEKYTDEGISPTYAKQQLYTTHMGAEVLRITPGVIEAQPVWEVYYTFVDDSGNKRLGYKYYRYDDGKEVRSVTLPDQ
jgi:uncharacterized protein YpmB